MSTENTPAIQLTPEQQQRAVAKNRINTLKATLAAPSVLEQFKNVLAENSGSFIASIIDLYNGSTDLQQCEPNAVIFEALKAASLKLPVNKSIGFAYIVAYKGIPTMLIGYKGYIQLAMRTGQYRIINTDEVFEGEYRTKNKLTGEYDLTGTKTSDKVVGYFAHFEILNGFSKTLYMTVEEVKAWAKKYSPSSASNYSPWVKEFPKMAMKTVLRNLLSHWGYMSVEMSQAMASDSDFEDIESTVVSEIKNNANGTELSFENAVIVDDKATEADKPVNGGNTSGANAASGNANAAKPGAGLFPSNEFNNSTEVKPEFN